MTGSGGIRAFEWREPDAMKVACPVLGGRGSGDALLLPDNSLDGASSHKSKKLKGPERMSLILLPPHSPELNPAERLWSILRRDFFRIGSLIP